MSESIGPALSPEQWARLSPTADVIIEVGVDQQYALVRGRGRHALAARCLAGQPFGFTREDATQLRALRIFIQTGVMPGLDTRADIEDWLETHIDRIEALLPPE